MKRYKGGAIVRRPKTTRYISIILMFCFTGTSSYAAVGLQTTPIRALADDLEVGGVDKWWLRHMIAKAEPVDDRPEKVDSWSDGYRAGLASGEIRNDTRAVYWAFSTVMAGAWLIGPLCLWGLAANTSKPSKDTMSKIQQTKGQEYIAGYVKGYSDINKKQKRKAVKVGVLTSAGLLIAMYTVILFSLVIDVSS